MKWGAATPDGEGYATLTATERRKAVERAESQPFPAGIAGAVDPNTPVLVEDVEWFGSLSDLCRVHSVLHAMAERPGLAQLREV